MKYMVTTRNNDAFFTLPQEKREEIVKATWAFVDKYRRSGQLKDIFYTPDLKGGVSVWELATPEEAARVTLESPGYAWQDMDVRSLIDWDVGNKAIIEFFAGRARK